ncbi:MAG: rRNA pseudouridine synthase [Chromatiaceae bacterium]|jgi:23S rRNA pseudouridine2605 synthase|nr:rRNA pseudouridine synthase [Chromatiaceae bacterium]
MKPKAVEGDRLQKLLANAGLGSRRHLETLISEGRVRVNGSVAKLGDRATAEDRIEVDGRPVGSKRLSAQQRFVIMYNKPEGELVTRHDPEGRGTVFDHLPRLPTGRWISVGRLDVNSSGLLLFSNDGELANRLMHPRTQIDREYAVRVNGEVTEEMVRRLVSGVELEDGPARFEDVVDAGGEGSNRWFHLVIMEGRKREVRRLWEAVGATVSRLKRVRYGPIILDSSVKVGQWRELQPDERRELLKVVDLKDDRPWGSLAAKPGKKKTPAAGSPWKARHKR